MVVAKPPPRFEFFSAADLERLIEEARYGAPMRGPITPEMAARVDQGAWDLATEIAFPQSDHRPAIGKRMRAMEQAAAKFRESLNPCRRGVDLADAGSMAAFLSEETIETNVDAATLAELARAVGSGDLDSGIRVLAALQDQVGMIALRAGDIRRRIEQELDIPNVADALTVAARRRSLRGSPKAFVMMTLATIGQVLPRPVAISHSTPSATGQQEVTGPSVRLIQGLLAHLRERSGAHPGFESVAKLGALKPRDSTVGTWIRDFKQQP